MKMYICVLDEFPDYMVHYFDEFYDMAAAFAAAEKE